MKLDEIGQLREAFDRMQKNLRQLIGEVTEKSREASSLAEQLSLITDQISQRATENAGAAVQISSGMDQVAERAQNVKRGIANKTRISYAKYCSLAKIKRWKPEFLFANELRFLFIGLLGPVPAKLMRSKCNPA